jgi:hypothetical protein
MPFGKPFERGQPKPPNSGRKKGQQSKPRTLRERIERRRALREAALDELYRTDSKRALELEAQMLRDDVALMRYEGEAGSEQSGRASEAQIEAQARAAGPITDEDAMKAYAQMLADTEESRVLLARHALFPLDEKPGKPQMVHLPHVRSLYKAVAAGEFRVRAEVTIAELLRELAPLSQPVSVAQARRGRTTIEPDPQPYAGIPTGDGSYVIPATPRGFRQREHYPDPPVPVIPIAEEPSSPEPVPRARASRDPFDDPSVTVVLGGGFVRR